MKGGFYDGQYYEDTVFMHQFLHGSVPEMFSCTFVSVIDERDIIDIFPRSAISGYFI